MYLPLTPNTLSVISTPDHILPILSKYTNQRMQQTQKTLKTNPDYALNQSIHHTKMTHNVNK